MYVLMRIGTHSYRATLPSLPPNGPSHVLSWTRESCGDPTVPCGNPAERDHRALAALIRHSLATSPRPGINVPALDRLAPLPTNSDNRRR